MTRLTSLKVEDEVDAWLAKQPRDFNLSKKINELLKDEAQQEEKHASTWLSKAIENGDVWEDYSHLNKFGQPVLVMQESPKLLMKRLQDEKEAAQLSDQQEYCKTKEIDAQSAYNERVKEQRDYLASFGFSEPQINSLYGEMWIKQRWKAKWCELRKLDELVIFLRERKELPVIENGGESNGKS